MSSIIRRIIFLLLGSTLVGKGQELTGGGAVTSVVVLANQNVPESISLALHYAAVRGIPTNQVILLNLPVSEEMNRQEYNNRLKAPLLQQLESRGLARRVEKTSLLKNAKEGSPVEYELDYCHFRYLVTMYGVPLRVKDTRAHIVHAVKNRLGIETQQDVAAVDSELCLLFNENYRIKGQIQNPFYDTFYIPPASPETHDLLLTTRLDGPSPDIVHRMIDQSLAAERYGIQGRAYIDTQGLSNGAYVEGDFWLFEVAERLKREGYETSVDAQRWTLRESYPMEDVAFYFGWYDEHMNGPFLRSDVQFTPGAMSTHIHSFSASTLRSTTEHWAGPLLARGAAVTSGAVFEPYLTYMPHVNILMDRVMRGQPLGDAAIMSMKSLSWQSVVIGDPLFRPFKYSLEQQIAHGEADQHPLLDYAYLRKTNLLVSQGRFNVALEFLRMKLQERNSIILREKLGDLYVLNGLMSPGIVEYNTALHSGDIPEPRAARLGAKLIYVYQQLGNVEQAEALETAVIEALKGHPVTSWFQAVVDRGKR